MQIVIEIPSEMYEVYHKQPPMLGDAGIDSIIQAIANGIPLPKCHGRLIVSPTMEEIEKTIGGKNDFADCIRESVKAVFDNAQAVIPSDKEDAMDWNKAIEELERHKKEFACDHGWNTSVIEAIDMGIKAMEHDLDGTDHGKIIDADELVKSICADAGVECVQDLSIDQKRIVETCIGNAPVIKEATVGYMMRNYALKCND